MSVRSRKFLGISGGGLVLGLALSSGLIAGPATAASYTWPSGSYLDCGYPYHPDVASRASGNVTHGQTQRGSQGYWNYKSWSNGGSTILRDFIAPYYQSQGAKITASGTISGKSWTCE